MLVMPNEKADQGESDDSYDTTRLKVREREDSLSKNKSIITMSLDPQRKCLQPLQQQERRKGIQRRTGVPQHFHTRFDGECSHAKRVNELEAVVTFGRFGEVGEFA